MTAFDLANVQPLNLGNSYTYTFTDSDKSKYSGFFLTTGDTITLSDGTNSITVAASAKEEFVMQRNFTTIVGTTGTNVVFMF